MSYRRGVIVFFLLLFWLAIRIPVRVLADEWQPISPDELKMTSVPEAPGAPAVILYREVDRKDLGRANTEYNYLRIKVLTEEGRKYANVEIPYNHQNMGISNVRARTIHPDGSIVNFDGKTYEQVIEKSKTTKYLARTFTMPDVQVGSIVEYHFNYDFGDGYVYDSHWILSHELFTKKGLFTLVPYYRWSVRWVWPAGLPANTTAPHQDPDKVIRMTVANVPAFHVEDYMPPENELKFRVDFVYSEESFEENADNYWRKFDKKQNGRVETFMAKHKAVDEAVVKLISDGDTPETKLQKIYERCQQVRNLSYEPFKSGEEEKRAKLKPNENADELWSNGYGNGYEITWLFLAMARAAKFEAYPALVASRSDYFFNPKRMNSKELTANVVLVKVNGKDLYFDPGAAFTPYGLLPWFETGVQGLRLDRDGGGWIETPLPESAASSVKRKGEFKLTEEGALTGKLTVIYTGLEAYRLRLEERNEDEAGRKKALEEWIKDDVPASIDVEVKNQPEWKNAALPLTVEYELKIDGWASGAGKRALLPVGLFSAPEKHMFEHSDRVFPVYFAFPFQKIDDITIDLPLGWKVANLPKPLDQDAKAVQFKLTADSNTTGVHFNRTLRSDLFLVPADKYHILRSFYQLVRSGDEGQIVLQQAAAAANN